MFSIRPAHAEQMLDDTLRASSAIVEALEEADAAADRLRSAWEGDASDAHVVARDDWRDEARRMVDALGEMRRALQGAHAHYSAAASVNSSMWAGGC